MLCKMQVLDFFLQLVINDFAEGKKFRYGIIGKVLRPKPSIYSKDKIEIRISLKEYIVIKRHTNHRKIAQ